VLLPPPLLNSLTLPRRTSKKKKGIDRASLSDEKFNFVCVFFFFNP